MLSLTLAFVLLGSDTGLYPASPVKSEAIETTTLSLKDKERSKDLFVRVTWPKSPKKHPILVWSHGMYGSCDAYQPLVEFWAGAGYVVFQPTHGDSISLMTQQQRRELLRNPNTNNTWTWKERPGDIKLVLDRLPEFESRIKALKGKLDTTRIGMGGHSFGAWTAQVVGGCTLTAAGQALDLSDPRPKAFVALSGQGPSPIMKPESFKGLKRPVLWTTGDNDTSMRGEKPEWRKEAYDLSAPGNKFLLWIDDAAHNYGGITERAESGAAVNAFLKRAGSTASSNPQHVKLVQSITLAFWDAFVMDKSEAKNYLKTREIEKAGGVTVSSK